LKDSKLDASLQDLSPVTGAHLASRLFSVVRLIRPTLDHVIHVQPH
jgi:hypothetical protein